ncbi:MAG: response regulator transcription factor [Bacteroidota bacterium]
MELLLVEDDQSLGYILSEYLAMHGFSVSQAADGEEGAEMFRQQRFDLCILDIMLPKKDGFTLATEIRKVDPLIPLIFLTSRALKVDKLKGFRLGADDYLVKPVDEEELIARIKAILKRSNYVETSPHPRKQKPYQIGQYLFDFSNQQLRLQDHLQTLTRKEADILRSLCENMGQITDRKQTLQDIWGGNDYFNRRSMDVYISRLRKYLNQDPHVKISNVHGRGFVLSVQQ